MGKRCNRLACTNLGRSSPASPFPGQKNRPGIFEPRIPKKRIRSKFGSCHSKWIVAWGHLGQILWAPWAAPGLGPGSHWGIWAQPRPNGGERLMAWLDGPLGAPIDCRTHQTSQTKTNRQTSIPRESQTNKKMLSFCLAKNLLILFIYIFLS